MQKEYILQEIERLEKEFFKIKRYPDSFKGKDKCLNDIKSSLRTLRKSLKM